MFYGINGTALFEITGNKNMNVNLTVLVHFVHQLTTGRPGSRLKMKHYLFNTSAVSCWNHDVITNQVYIGRISVLRSS